MSLTKRTLVVMFTIVTALTMAVSVVSGQQSSVSSNAQERTIVGAWRTVITGRNCQTGDPLGSFPGLFTINEGGTMSEYGIGPGSSPALRSPGHGVWKRGHGWQDFSLTFTYYRYNASGVFTGSQKV